MRSSVRSRLAPPNLSITCQFSAPRLIMTVMTYPELTGTWRLVEVADLDKDGKWQYRFGEHPRGYFVYDATGHLHIQIMKTPPLAPFPEANAIKNTAPTAEHALAAYGS